VRLYSVAVASLAIDAPIKWTDNLIAHHGIPDVRSRSRGVARGVPWAGLVRIALIRELHVALGCGVREAVALAEHLLHAPDGSIPVGRWSTIGFGRDALERDLQRRLAEVIESAPRPKRGRPARRAVAEKEHRLG
jgi:hypothetical protein